MFDLAFEKQAELWGRSYEILVKRGVLACLIEEGRLSPEHAQLQAWRELTLLDASKAQLRGLRVVDETVREQVQAALQHLAVSAYALGYTAMREYLRHLQLTADYQVRALWCPLDLPDAPHDHDQYVKHQSQAFHSAFAMSGIVDRQLAAKGEPANADFVLLLGAAGKPDYLLIQEYSFDMPAKLRDFREPAAHLAELQRYQRLIERRSVFARINAEVEPGVEGEQFAISPDLSQQLNALSSGNKPFYKLCQACSYATKAAHWLHKGQVLRKPTQVRALAITPNGLESIAANFADDVDPRWQLMEALGSAYRAARKIRDGDERALSVQVQELFDNLRNRLPSELRHGLKKLQQPPQVGENFTFEFTEEVRDFVNPEHEYPLSAALGMILDDAQLTTHFGQAASSALLPFLQQRLNRAGAISLRNLHAAAVAAGLAHARSGVLNILALEGNPGIGKTTAVRNYLAQQSEGFLLLYLSPRVVINREVMHNFANKDGQPSGILTVTTNAELIAAAERWHEQQRQQGRSSYAGKAEAAVVASGVADLPAHYSSTLILSPEDEKDIDANHPASRLSKQRISEYEDAIKNRPLPGVLSTLARTTRQLLDGLRKREPTLNRVVMAVALQSFRNKQDGKTTLQALTKIFRNDVRKSSGVMERRQFMQRIPNIVVMVDELAGDGAGAPFVHEIADWLDEQFIRPAQQGEELGRVTLVLSDASLANEVVLERYLAAGEQRAPDKVLVSHSRGKRVFDLAYTTLKLGTGTVRPALHVMTNSFPASRLQLEYKVRSSIVPVGNGKDGRVGTVRQALRQALGEKVQQSAIEEILRALQAGATQVIYFAQDKKMLGEMDGELRKQQPHLQVAVLDSSVPAHEREALLKPAQRDATHVFLMTSSGARGISFPKADWIIATMPRFNIETALMEIAQLIYRGRGHYLNAQQQWVSGDKVPRHLVLLTDDGVVVEPGESVDLRQWLRQAIDLLTMLVMLRATIFTRISGDAGLKQPLALVPVGAVGVEETISLMAQSVRNFVSESHAALADLGQRQRSLLMSAQKGVRELFAASQLCAIIGGQSDPRSMVNIAAVRALHDLAAGMLQPLLIFSRNGTSLAPRLYANGPLFVEDWGDFQKEEIFNFAGYNSAANEHLLKQLHFIRKDQKIPRNIRSAAIDLSRILQRRAREEAGTTFSTTKALTSSHLWVALPAGYAQFMDERSPPYSDEDGEAWRDGLARGLGSSHAPLPPLPRYAAFPWAARVGVADPLQLATVFDDRYFMACNELNLLNTLLLANAQSTHPSHRTISSPNP